MKLLIAGSGKMGTDIFYYILPYGYEMVWLCYSEEEAEQTRNHFKKKADRQLRAEIIDQAAYEKMFSDVTITTGISLAAGADLVIETIWEQAADKRSLLARLDAVLPETAIITSNTSSVPLKDIVPIGRKKSFCGMHFFFPVRMKNLVELNVLQETDPDVLQQLKDFLKEIERQALVLSPEAHFIMNRLLLPVQNEAVLLLQEYPVSVFELDALVRNSLFPVGIFEFFDHVGNDVMLASVNNYTKSFNDGTDYSLLTETLRKKVQENLLGIKTGMGFYQHPIEPEKFVCSLPDVVRHALIQRLEKAFYTAVSHCIQSGLLAEQALDEALMEYWSAEESFLEKGRKKGYFV